LERRGDGCLAQVRATPTQSRLHVAPRSEIDPDPLFNHSLFLPPALLNRQGTGGRWTTKTAVAGVCLPVCSAVDLVAQQSQSKSKSGGGSWESISADMWAAGYQRNAQACQERHWWIHHKDIAVATNDQAASMLEKAVRSLSLSLSLSCSCSRGVSSRL